MHNKVKNLNLITEELITLKIEK